MNNSVLHPESLKEGDSNANTLPHSASQQSSECALPALSYYSHSHSAQTVTNSAAVSQHVAGGAAAALCKVENDVLVGGNQNVETHQTVASNMPGGACQQKTNLPSSQHQMDQMLAQPNYISQGRKFREFS